MYLKILYIHNNLFFARQVAAEGRRQKDPARSLRYVWAPKSYPRNVKMFFKTELKWSRKPSKMHSKFVPEIQIIFYHFLYAKSFPKSIPDPSKVGLTNDMISDIAFKSNSVRFAKLPNREKCVFVYARCIFNEKHICQANIEQ